MIHVSVSVFLYLLACFGNLFVVFFFDVCRFLGIGMALHCVLLHCIFIVEVGGTWMLRAFFCYGFRGSLESW
jgi:hypothetical protein